jgi:hypothetical protein
MSVGLDEAQAVPAGRVVDGHRLSEFIYGTVTGMVAVTGISGGREAGWWEAAAIVLVGAIAVWLAHAYSVLIAERVATGHRLGARALRDALRGTLPIVSSGALLAIPILPSAAGMYSVTAALTISSTLGVVVLAFIGLLAGSVTRETWPRRLLLAFLSAGLGLVIVAVELAVRH